MYYTFTYYTSYLEKRPIKKEHFKSLELSSFVLSKNAEDGVE